MSLLVVTPVLIPLATSLLCTLAKGRSAIQRTLSFVGAASFLAAAALIVVHAAAGEELAMAFGGWAPPFGIEFRIDRLGAILVLVTAIMGFAALIALEGGADPGARHPVLLPLVHGLLAGVGGAFSTADLFNLYVWFEVMLITAIGLFAIGGRLAQLDASLKYFVLNLFGTLLLLAAVGGIYAATGQLHFDALRTAHAALPEGVRLATLAALCLALLIKSGAVPFAAWLPASYHTLPAPILALFAGLLTKVGAYALLRALGDVFVPAPSAIYEVLGWIACATMLGGVLGAAYHFDMRRILAFHVISQIGYILLGIALAGAGAKAATLFYIVHHILVKANLFFLAAIIARSTGSYDLRRIGGLFSGRPALAILFLIPALSLVGIPPLSGFWAKVLVLQEALAAGRVTWTIVALVVSALTLYSMLKIWMEAFWKPHPTSEPSKSFPGFACSIAPALILACLTLLISLSPETLMRYATLAARSLGVP